MMELAKMQEEFVVKAYSVAETHKARPRVTRSWFEAYRLFLRNPKELLSVKLLPLIALGIVPLSLADDVLLPFIGVFDNLPTGLFVLYAVFRTWRRVREYR